MQRQQRLNKKARGLGWKDLVVLAELKGVAALENVSRECQTAAAGAAARISAAAAATAAEAAPLAPAPAAGNLPPAPPRRSGGSDSEPSRKSKS
eukprot:15447316-Alexandrium_andersonii.AAC.1